jgi:hypothetical protein
MNIQKIISSFVFFIMAAVLLAETPYATITYAEGKRFSVIRDGKSVSYGAESPEAIGLPIQRGDILQTTPGTFLEVLIHPISASIQLAENTTFRCDADESGMQSEGKLYYGRVRAKVAKLTGTSTYKITTPGLVAGVRGTDFGCDHFYVRPCAPSTPDAAQASPTLNRVFCFEGHVAVAPAVAPADETVMIGGGEMVENSTPAAGDSAKEPVPIAKAPVSTEVSDFWKGREFHAAPDAASVEESAVITEEKRQEVEKEVKRERNHKIRLAGSAALFLTGALVCYPAYTDYQNDGMSSSVMMGASYGGFLIGSSLVLLIYDLVRH